MTRHRNLRRGACITGAIVAVSTLVLVACLGYSYDGRCSGFFPELSAAQQCSLWQYVSGEGLAIALVLLWGYWPIIMAIVALPPALGYFIDWRARVRD